MWRTNAILSVVKEIRDDVSMVFEGPKYMLHGCKIKFTLLECEQLAPL